MNITAIYRFEIEILKIRTPSWELKIRGIRIFRSPSASNLRDVVETQDSQAEARQVALYD